MIRVRAQTHTDEVVACWVVRKGVKNYEMCRTVSLNFNFGTKVFDQNAEKILNFSLEISVAVQPQACQICIDFR